MNFSITQAQASDAQNLIDLMYSCKEDLEQDGFLEFSKYNDETKFAVYRVVGVTADTGVPEHTVLGVSFAMGTTSGAWSEIFSEDDIVGEPLLRFRRGPG